MFLRIIEWFCLACPVGKIRWILCNTEGIRGVLVQRAQEITLEHQ